MAEKPRILVVGSVNMDMVVRSPHMPAPGETVLGDEFVCSPGGKGANQAVAVSRLEGQCFFLGRIGDDVFGRQLKQNLLDEDVDCTGLMVTEDVPSGVAMIVVDSSCGENSIVVASGANFRLTPDDIFASADLFGQSEIVILQLELPLPTVRAAIQVARRNGCRIILDPAPAQENLPAELFQVDIFSPNVSEAEILTGKKAIEERVDKRVAMDLIDAGAHAAVLKLGSRGSLVVSSDGHFYKVPAFKVNIVDTTAAGDAFTAALAVAVGRGRGLHEAARFANAAGALACTQIGAQQAMPTLEEVALFMADQAMG